MEMLLKEFRNSKRQCKQTEKKSVRYQRYITGYVGITFVLSKVNGRVHAGFFVKRGQNLSIATHNQLLPQVRAPLCCCSEGD